ncbi:MAG TPA: hypothetical protein ENN36_07655 [Candidatus Bathyarchaeota archaeon]|mgnify:CR=1 FL=1|nr:hypothetical protein [Candidatus Bathyarchaeota archaeon]
MDETIPTGSPVYVQYKKEKDDSVVCETMGWLTKKAGGYVFIEHNRTTESILTSSGFGDGIIVHDNCILKKQLIRM